MSSHAARRWESYRRRKRSGRSCYTLTLDDAAVETFLEAAGLLQPGIEHDKQIVLVALKQWLDEQLGEEGD